MDNKDITHILNGLIQTCKDGERGFLTCAENASAAELKTLFAARARDCSVAAGELQQRASALGATPETGGSISGALHRGWVDLKAAVTGQDDVAILNECERGEDVALKSYRSALTKPMPSDIQALIQRQAEGVQRNHDEIKALRNRYRALDNPSAIRSGEPMDSTRDPY